jgi:hypothetical protein
MPAGALLQVLEPAYGPCAGFATACKDKARWSPVEGHVPRGFCGAAGGVDEVRLILVCAEPGDPHAEESHEGGGTAPGRLESASRYAWEGFKTGKDQFHRNVRKVLDLCWPDSDFDTQMRLTWITDSVLCSAQAEGGRVSIKVERECGHRYLIPQLGLFTGAIVAALGRKAQHRLTRAGVTDFIAVGSVAPPGCNNSGVAESWERLGMIVRERFPSTEQRKRGIESITVFVKLTDDNAVKVIPATHASDDGSVLVLWNGEKVIARFTLDRVDHWYSQSREQT